MSPIKTQINRWLDELERVHGRGAETVRNYHLYLKRFLAWSNITAAREIDRALIDRYRQWLGSQPNPQRRPLEHSTQNYHLIALRSFLAYLRAHRQPALPPEQVRLFTVRPALPHILGPSELEALLAAPQKTGEAEAIQLRDKTLMELLFATKLRLAELAALKRSALGPTLTVTATDKTPRQLALTNQSRYWLERYLAKRADHSPALFVRFDRARSKTVDALTPRSIQRLIHRYATVVGLSKKITPQTIRNTVAHRLVESGANLSAVKTQLGHASAITTKRYGTVAAANG